MGAVARACRAGGGRTVGIIPAALLALEVGDQDADELLVVDDMRVRKGLMESRADAFLVLPGGLGTLEELTEIWTGRLLGLHTKPIVVLDVDGLYAPLRAQLQLMVDRGFVHSDGLDLVVWVTTIEAAFAALETGLLHQVRRMPYLEEVLETEP